MTELFNYGLRLVQRKRERPENDVMSRLCAADDLSDADVAAV